MVLSNVIVDITISIVSPLRSVSLMFKTNHRINWDAGTTLVGSFAVHGGDHLRLWDHLQSNLGIICSWWSFVVSGSFAVLYSALRLVHITYRLKLEKLNNLSCKSRITDWKAWLSCPSWLEDASRGLICMQYLKSCFSPLLGFRNFASFKLID